MNIEFKSNKLERECTDYKAAVNKYGDIMAQKLAQRMTELQSADTVEMLVQFSVGRCHPLKGNRKGEYAMDLVHPYRLIFENKNSKLKLIKIISIEDYH